jgi:hypothetical protein
MTLTLNGPLLKTGKGYGGAPMAVLHAPAEASPGSLASITRFFLDHDLRCLPGYSGSEQSPVLRLSGYGSDEALLQMLREKFPRWQESQGIPVQERIAIALDFTAVPIDRSVIDHRETALGRFMGRHSNLLPALCYLLGDAGMFIAGKGEQTGGPDHLKMAAAVAYTTAMVNLIAFGGKADNAKTAVEIMQKIDPAFRGDDAADTAHSVAQKTFGFLTRHPWEVSGLITLAGSSAYLLSSILRLAKGDPKASAEIFASIASIAGVSVQVFVPEKGTDSFARFGDTVEKQRQRITPLTSAALQKTFSETVQGPFDQFTSWVSEKPMKLTAALSAACTLGMGASGIIAGAKGSKLDKGMLAASGFYLAGNALQALTTKVKGPSFDDIVTAAADKLAVSRPGSGGVQSRDIQRVSEALVRLPEVRSSPAALDAAIRQRMEKGPTGGSFVERYIGMEADALRRSPFVVPSMFRSNALSEASRPALG